MSDAAHSDTARSAREDIAFMRNLAEAGASGPLLGGSFLLATGLIYAAAIGATWLITATRVPSLFWNSWPWIWGGALTTQIVVLTFIGFRLRRGRSGVATRSNRVFAWTWNGVGMAIFACLVSFFLDAKLGHSWRAFEGLPVVILALYGVGWMATAASSNERWAWVIAALSFLFAIAVGPLARNPNVALVFALALLLLALPGALLIKRAKDQA
jgi:hypothetical protein